MMLRLKNQNAYEKQYKFVNERIISVEKHFAEMCTGFAAYSRKAARVRDKGDELAKILQIYSDSERVNKSLSIGLMNFSHAVSLISDYRDAEVRRLDSKVIQELSQYESNCRHAKEELKHSLSTRDKEVVRKRQLDRVRERNPRNRQQISLAENELSKASIEVARTIKGLENQTDTFEKQKLHNIKSILLSFIQIELAMHTKAVEILSAAYQDISNIDEQNDFEDFQNLRGTLDREYCRSMKIQDIDDQQSHSPGPIHPPSQHPTSSRVKAIQQSRLKSQSMGALFNTPSIRRRGVQHKQQIQSNSEDVINNLGQSMDSINSGRYAKIRFEAENVHEIESDHDDVTDDSDIPPQGIFKSRERIHKQ